MRTVGYGRRNTTEVIHMEKLDDAGKKAHVKKLWMDESEKYYEWKNRCIELESLPDFFGTRDNRIPIDESKL